MLRCNARRFCFAWLALLACIASRADDSIDVNATRVVVIGSCNLTILVNTGTASLPGCNAFDSEDSRKKFLQWFETTPYGRQAQEVAQQRARIEWIANQVAALDASSADAARQMLNLSDEIRWIVAAQLRDRTNLRHLVQDLVQSARDEFSDAIVMQEEALDVLTLQSQQNQARIAVVNLQLLNFGFRLDRVETDLRFLMQRFLDGQLDQTLIFVDASIGALLSDSSFHPRYALAAELLTPAFKNWAMRFEWGRVDWRVEHSYPTLDGLEPVSFTLDRTQDYGCLGIVYRTPLRWRAISMKLGALSGVSRSRNATGLYGATLIQAEWVRRTLLVSFGLRGDYFQTVPAETREFNELGNATVRRELQDSIVPSLELHFSARMR